ncbi:VanZ family protein [Cupriavidus gilardii J11]|uniref:VanZ family protein n=1 Tax=Cupriavidus gilardii J11 TaxID=936133 RepID=A0A562BK71_9BURK|nr:VanZ family protein [Cupriavidus gilardii]TWG85279.1 VanZ family protein [Cupriavidus gilardii J11]
MSEAGPPPPAVRDAGITATAVPPAEPRHSPLARVALLCITLLMIYASLYPLAGWTDNGISPWAYLSAPKPRYITDFDLLTNVLGYCPFGALVVLSLYPRITGARAALVAFVAGVALSGALEALQTWLPNRIPSNIDLMTNALGALLGGTLVAPAASTMVDRGTLRRLRVAWFEPHASFAIVLLALWPFAQIFPQEHLLGMGGMVRQWLSDPDSWPMQMLQSVFPKLLDLQEQIGPRPDDMQRQQLLESLITACAWIGTGLFASVAMRRQAPVLRILATLLASALLLKALAADWQFPGTNAFAWLSEGGRFALITSSLALVLLVRLPRWLRGVLAMATLLTLVILTNVLPSNPYAWVSDEAWRLARLVHFNSLAQWLGWLWPFLAFCYLAWRLEQFGLERRRQRRMRRRMREQRDRG